MNKNKRTVFCFLFYTIIYTGYPPPPPKKKKKKKKKKHGTVDTVDFSGLCSRLINSYIFHLAG